MFDLNSVVTSGNYYDVCLEVNGEREDGRRNSVTLFRIPGDSDNSIVNSQVTSVLSYLTIDNTIVRNSEQCHRVPSTIFSLTIYL